MTPSDTPRASLTRRGLLTLGGAVVLQGCTSDHDPKPRETKADRGPLPTIRPIWSGAAHRGFGVCAHPNHLQTAYRFTDEWLAGLSEIGVGYFRGLYDHRLNVTPTTTALSREHGLRWGMLVDQGADAAGRMRDSDETIRERIAHIAANAADVCLFVEGVNEPNSSRVGTVRRDWPVVATQRQKLIWDAVRSHPSLDQVPVLGPSLNASFATEDDYVQLREKGILDAMDIAGVHSYPGGFYPDHALDERLQWVQRQWPGVPLWLTEIGYTNALDDLTAQRPVPEDVSALYAPAAVLEAVDRGLRVAWYEALDDPDPGLKDQVENNFGLFAVGPSGAPPWRTKPAGTALRQFLAELRDPGPAYEPEPVGVRVTCEAKDLRWTALAKRDGSVRLFLRRSTECWDPDKQVPIGVPEVEVRIESESRVRTIHVGNRVTIVPL